MIGATSNWLIWRSKNQTTQIPGLWTRGLLIRRRIADGDLAFFTTWCQRETSIETLVAIEGHRLAIEDSFETAKNEFGLDHNESRSWHGWHRHVSMVMLAFAMMAAIRHRAIRRHQKKPKRRTTAKTNHSHAVVDPMVDPGSPPHRHRARAKSGYNPHTSSRGHSGVELIRRSLSEPTSKQNGNCNARTHSPVIGYTSS